MLPEGSEGGAYSALVSVLWFVEGLIGVVVGGGDAIVGFIIAHVIFLSSGQAP